MNLATDIQPIYHFKVKTAIKDIENYQNIKSSISFLKLLAEGEKEIQSGNYVSQDSFFETIEAKLA